MAPRIVVLDGYTTNPGDNPWDRVAALGPLEVYERTPPGLLLERAAGAEVLVTNKTVLDAATIEQLPELKFISILATGYNVVDVEACRARGVVVSNVPAYSTDSVAQLSLALLLALCHRVEHHSDRVRDEAWTTARDFCFWDNPLVELAGLTLGVVGFGQIGRRTARLGHAFGMKVLAATRTQQDPPDYGPFAWRTIPELFAEADVVSLHCPQTEDNVGFVGRDLLARMKPSAFLINTARGALVNEHDLAEALNGGALAGAAVDVLATEPPTAGNPLLSARNCLITPHLAWATLAARQRLMTATAENIVAFLAGHPIHVVG